VQESNSSNILSIPITVLKVLSRIREQARSQCRKMKESCSIIRVADSSHIPLITEEPEKNIKTSAHSINKKMNKGFQGIKTPSNLSLTASPEVVVKAILCFRIVVIPLRCKTNKCLLLLVNSHKH
jgi:hypothetical protein